MEPRAAVCEYDPAPQHYTLYAGSGGAVRLKTISRRYWTSRRTMCGSLMYDVGGNFGTRGMIYPEFCVVAWAARRVGRPVKWTCERQEAFLSDYQARDLAVEAELALDAEGTFLAMRGSNIGNAGGHTDELLARCKRASRSCRASTACPPRISARARCSATRRRRGLTAAPAARKSCM